MFGSFGLSIVTAAWCLWRSGLFPRVLNVLGLAGGAGMTLVQLATAPSLAGFLTALNVAILLAWTWMIWAGVLVWRRSPRRGSASLAAG